MDIAAAGKSTLRVSTAPGARSEKLLALAEKLRESLRLPAGIATAMRSKVFGLSLLGLAAGAWLAFFCWQSLRTGWAVTLLLTLVLLLPGMALYVVQYILGGVAQLPQRLDALMASLRGNMNTYRDAREAATARRKVGWRDLGQMVKALREFKGLADESSELVAVAGQSLAVINPLFLLVLISASLLTLLLTLAALVTLLFYLW